MCVSVALGIQHAMRMQHIVICGPPRSTIFYHILSYTARFAKENLLKRKCVLRVSLQLLSEIYLIQRRTERGMVEKMYWLSCKIHFNLVGF